MMRSSLKKTDLSRRDLLKLSSLVAAQSLTGCFTPSHLTGEKSLRKPNIVIIFADDMGYGDMGCMGHPTIATPNLDKMAAQGIKLTQFYSAASVCTPSRAALLTGRLPIRSGMCSSKRRVLFPNSAGGLPESEITIAKALKSAGYATACIGKWHLGHLQKFMPNQHGFDYYYGIPYSNDMRPTPLIENNKTIEEPANQKTLTRRYTQKAVSFIRKNKSKPFFLYFPHTFPHIPLFASAKFKDKSIRGLYGDVIEELDWSVGVILDTLRKYHLDRNTLVIFTSDNGPWLPRKLNGGSAGLLRGGKGSTWEGGMREPALAWWPGKIPPATVTAELASTLDLFPTCLALAGVKPPTDRILDGYNILPVLQAKQKSPRKVMFFYRGTKIYAVRSGPWKLHLIIQAGYGDKSHPQDTPLLFHLDHDPSENFDVAPKNPDVVETLLKIIEDHRATVIPVPSQLEIALPKKRKKPKPPQKTKT